MQKIFYVEGEKVQEVNSTLAAQKNAKVVSIVPLFDAHSINSQGVRAGFGAYVVVELDF